MHRLLLGAALVVLVTGCASPASRSVSSLTSASPERSSPPAAVPSRVGAEAVATVGGRTYHREPLCNASSCAGCSADPGSPAIRIWAVDGADRRVYEWVGCAEDAPRIRDLR